MPPRQLRSSIPRELEFICLKCLEKDPRKRYPTAADLAADLKRYLRGRGASCRPDQPGHTPAAVGAPRVGSRLPAGRAGPDPGAHPGQFPDQSRPRRGRAPGHHGGRAALAVLLALAAPRGAQRAALGADPNGWITLDVAILAAILRILGAADSSLIVGFPMLIAASGLWNRVRLVWLTTVLSMLGYLILAIDVWLRDAPRDSNHHPDIVLAGLAVTGLVIAQQVRRIRALSGGTSGRPPKSDPPRTSPSSRPSPPHPPFRWVRAGFLQPRARTDDRSGARTRLAWFRGIQGKRRTSWSQYEGRWS